ncbi:MAG: hypothetical protein EBQ79_05165, partial [Actinobacteria bacterium]|nr:hypothetical protein [Actinomycetota bacterium]
MKAPKKARDVFSSPIASAAAVIIAVIWTIPTFGLVSFIYPSRARTSTQTVGGTSSCNQMSP